MIVQTNYYKPFMNHNYHHHNYYYHHHGEE